MAHLIETALAHHAAQYYIRGMRVLNDLVQLRRLPDDCQSCWGRFSDDLDPLRLDQAKRDRWNAGEYQAAGNRDDARFVDRECKTPFSLFLNAGSKEDASAKELGRLSLEALRQQLGEYTVNRLWMNVAWDVAIQLSAEIPGQQPPRNVAEVLPMLDSVYANADAVLLARSKWRAMLEVLVADGEALAGPIEDARAVLGSRDVSLLEFEAATRQFIAETALTTRYFGRYVEVLNSLLGGGALPSNQDPKAMIARGGRLKMPFHLAVNDSLLELLVAIFSCEAEEAGEALSFTDFLDRLSERYRLNVDRGATAPAAGTGLTADAVSQSRQALRGRMSAMGFLTEFSDSASWNRVSWGR